MTPAETQIELRRELAGRLLESQGQGHKARHGDTMTIELDNDMRRALGLAVRRDD